MSASKGTAIVTGSAQGIGRSIALRLAKDGFDITLNDVPAKQAQLEQVAAEIKAEYNRRVIFVLGDVSKEADVKQLVEESVAKLGPVLRVMVTNAGILRAGKAVDTTVEAFDETFSVNVRGVWLCYKYAAKQMIAQGLGGRIIAASSTVGRQAFSANAIAYTSSKFAVRGLTQSAAIELGQHGITVNCYAPGFIDTEMLRNAPSLKIVEEQRAQAGAEAKKNSAVRIPPTAIFAYNGKPEDIASVVSYLASDESHFITGQTLGVDGGLYLS